jgi:hypothetical protein
VVKELAGRAGARLLTVLAADLSHRTALRAPPRIPLPTGRTPRVIGVDDFALRRRHRCATAVIDAETHERIDVLPDRTADTLQAWLSEHPGVEVVCCDDSATYAEAIRRTLPDAVQVADRSHGWHNLCEAALSEVKAHSTCWAAALDVPLYEGPRAQTTLERWHQVHGLLGQGVGLLECARRLQLALNTVKSGAAPVVNGLGGVADHHELSVVALGEEDLLDDGVGALGLVQEEEAGIDTRLGQGPHLEVAVVVEAHRAVVAALRTVWTPPLTVPADLRERRAATAHPPVSPPAAGVSPPHRQLPHPPDQHPREPLPLLPVRRQVRAALQ